ncbi:hypothetical protein RCH18_001330 [Flavobacterium sp. PL11]|nr:hypothetical protein [Flavobacterium sp. PL11]
MNHYLKYVLIVIKKDYCKLLSLDLLNKLYFTENCHYIFPFTKRISLPLLIQIKLAVVTRKFVTCRAVFILAFKNENLSTLVLQS